MLVSINTTPNCDINDDNDNSNYDKDNDNNVNYNNHTIFHLAIDMKCTRTSVEYQEKGFKYIPRGELVNVPQENIIFTRSGTLVWI